MPIIRIAPVCNGKIYVVPRRSSQTGEYLLDIPIEEQFQHASVSEKSAQKLKERYGSHIHTSEQPRFSVKYKLKHTDHDIVYLYILPLKDEGEINFCQGEFMTAEEIQTNTQSSQRRSRPCGSPERRGSRRSQIQSQQFFPLYQPTWPQQECPEASGLCLKVFRVHPIPAFPLRSML